MKPSYSYRLLNDPFGDPVLYVRFVREKKAMLFDAGDLRNATPSELHKVTDVFVTHTHIDHFIGFDVLLRIILRRDLPINIYGPRSIIPNVAGKLKGYTWNLIEEYPTIINVFGFDGSSLTHARFRAENRFKKEVINSVRTGGLLLDAPDYAVRAVRLDHGIPCLAYSLEEKPGISIDKDRLLKKGLTVGPWLTEFRKRLLQGRTKGTIYADNRRLRMSDITDIARTNQGQKFSFVTDVSMSRRNISRLEKFIKGSYILFCEAYFLDREKQLAAERGHLTAGECGRLARKAGVERLLLMHFSPKYTESPELLVNEAEEAFGRRIYSPLCHPVDSHCL